MYKSQPGYIDLQFKVKYLHHHWTYSKANIGLVCWIYKTRLYPKENKLMAQKNVIFWMKLVIKARKNHMTRQLCSCFWNARDQSRLLSVWFSEEVKRRFEALWRRKLEMHRFTFSNVELILVWSIQQHGKTKTNFCFCNQWKMIQEKPPSAFTWVAVGTKSYLRPALKT